MLVATMTFLAPPSALSKILACSSEGEMHGRCRGDAWEMHGRFKGDAWEIYGGRFKGDLGLQLRGQQRVDGEHADRRHLVAKLGEPLGHRGADGDDVFLAGHEDEDVAGRLREVDLHRLLDRALDVVLARRLGEE